MDKTYTKIEKHSNGPFVQINLDASARGANCYEDEIDAVIAALQEAKTKCKNLDSVTTALSYTKEKKQRSKKTDMSKKVAGKP